MSLQLEQWLCYGQLEIFEMERSCQSENYEKLHYSERQRERSMVGKGVGGPTEDSKKIIATVNPL
jgi:hypothetical protein